MVPPLVEVDVKLTGAPAQVGLVPKVIAIEIVGGAPKFAIVMVILLLLANDGLAQFASDVIVHATTSLSNSAVEVNVELLVPTFILFTVHW